MRAGPSPGKPFADAALAAMLVRAQRARPFDLALAHNGEAALVALCARAATGLGFVYVAHTLLGLELSSYAPAAWRPALDRAGRRLDRTLAARADGVLALSSEAAKQLGRDARGPLAVIPPGLDPVPAPAPEEVARACARFGLDAGRLRALRRQPRRLSGARRPRGGGAPARAAAGGGRDAAGGGRCAVAPARAPARRLRRGARARLRRGGGGAPAPDPGRLSDQAAQLHGGGPRDRGARRRRGGARARPRGLAARARRERPETWRTPSARSRTTPRAPRASGAARARPSRRASHGRRSRSARWRSAARCWQEEDRP